jgi:hypothetical protein
VTNGTLRNFEPEGTRSAPVFDLRPELADGQLFARLAGESSDDLREYAQSCSSGWAKIAAPMATTQARKLGSDRRERNDLKGQRQSTLAARILQNTSRFTTSMLGQAAAIATSLAGAIYAFRKLEGPLGGKPLWLQLVIVAGPITLALVFNTIPTLVREHQNAVLKRMAIDGRDISPGYFSLAPRVDEKSFVRADEIHTQVVRWIEQRRGRILYLTGLSGSGKTSLLLAWVRPQLEKAGYRMLVVRGFERYHLAETAR